MLVQFIKTTGILLVIVTALLGGGIGVMRSIDFIEQKPHQAKGRIQYIVMGVTFAHVFFLMRGMSILQLIFSLSIQYCYNTMFDIYPIVKPEDVRFLYGTFASLINHFLLIRFFVQQNVGIITILLSFLIIWTTPFAFFFSMNAVDNTLFIRRSGIQRKTYVAQIIDFLMSLGRPRKSSTPE